MARVLITADDINYNSGAQISTIAYANYLSKKHQIDLYSEVKAAIAVKRQLKNAVHLCKELDYSKYDYIIVPFENSKFRREVSRLENVVKIQWIHIDYELWRNVVSLNLEEEFSVLQSFDRIVFVSQANKDGFLRIFPELEEKCVVIYNYLDIEQIRKKAKADWDSNLMEKKRPSQLNIVMAGRLEGQKNYHRVIDIAKILRDQEYNVEWYILGKGYEYDELSKRCSRHSLSNVHFLGHRSNPYPFMKAADVFALLSNYEGFGMCNAEALAVGTPVLATDTGCTREVINDDEGWIVENNINAIVRKIKELYDNREFIEQKRENLSQYKYRNTEIDMALDRLFYSVDDIKTVPKAERINCISEEISHVPNVSIIVPVYNMEAYLSECLESLVNQTLDNIEIVVVNDGATDNSQSIIDRYVYHYPEKIRAYTIKNGGLGKARNYGIQKARAKYLGFVDSDDVVERNMFEILYHEAIKNCADCVLCDYIATWPSGKSEYVSSIVGNNIDRFDILKYSAKYGVVNACTKLVDKSLFEYCLFPEGFYEDLATMPIILSYANKIHYVKRGLYYYRQRSGSITSIKTADKRLFDCYKAWDRILQKSNPIFKKELVFAVRWSINFFCTNFLSDFVMHSKSYYDKNRSVFEGNEYIEEAVKNGEFEDFDHYPLIPKKIHYCWFGKNEKTDLINQCIESWKKYAPGFEIIEWNETNCDINENEYVKEAYKQKKYAFVSDYFRFKALEKHGGVYMDTDMELMQDITPYLLCSAFFAFETPIFVHAGIIGAIPHHKIIQSVLEGYKEIEFENGELGIPETSPMKITKVLEKDPLFIKNGKTQMVSDHVKVYSANVMTMNFYDGNCVSNHHYEGSWMKGDRARNHLDNYGYQVMRHYFTWDLVEKTTPSVVSPQNANTLSNEEHIAQLNYYKSECERLENSTCWKITKPIRMVGDFLKRLRKKGA